MQKKYQVLSIIFLCLAPLIGQQNVRVAGATTFSRDGKIASCSAWVGLPSDDHPDEKSRNVGYADVYFIDGSSKRLPTICNFVDFRGQRATAYWWTVLPDYHPIKGVRVYFKDEMIGSRDYPDKAPAPKLDVTDWIQENQVRLEWTLEKNSQFSNGLHMRWSYDKGATWAKDGGNHSVGKAIKDAESSIEIPINSREEAPKILVEFWISQGLILTVKRYEVGRGMMP